MKLRILILVSALLALVGCKGKSEEEKMAEYEAWTSNFMQEYQTRVMSLQGDEEALEEYSDSAITAFIDYNKAAVKANRKNAVSIAAVRNLYGLMEMDELVEIMETVKAPLHDEDSVFFASVMTAYKAQSSTQEGQKFVDFEVDGVKFSDFIGRGKYVLVDFWASWCGPCRREMPNLRAVYEEFHGDQFDMLSVAVWDDPEDTAKAAEEEGIAWNQIVNAQKIPTDLYGIEGIPHIILFGPDGTILKRNLRGSAIREAVAEALDR